jgi:20S proteasome subunit beta 6
VAIAGEDFCIVASDTRQSSGYSINTRYAPKAFKMYLHITTILFTTDLLISTDKAVLACSGMYADATELVRNIDLNVKVPENHVMNQEKRQT